jgi:glycosyltransferase involved in cell wall biosynthesis
MKVLMLSFISGILVEDYLKPLITSLLQTGQVADITLVVPEYNDAPSFIEDLGISNFEVRKFRFWSSLSRAMLGALNPNLYHRLVKDIEAINPDIVHIVFEHRVPFLLVAELHQKYPIVSTIHEPRAILHTALRSSVLNLIQETNCKFIMKSSDKIIVHGQNHMQYLLAKSIPDHKIRIIPHGAFLSFAPLRNDEVQTQPENILFFGRITPYKGIEYLIEAGKRIIQQFPEITITIAGEGDFNKYERLIKGDSHFTICNRFIPDSEVATLFQKAAIVVLPYTDGSQSGIISIAGSFKKPVVVTNVGNFSEMVENGKTGFVVAPRDAMGLAKAIIKLLKNDKLRQEMGENAYSAIQERFSWDDIAQKTVCVYEEVMKIWRTDNFR